MKTKNQSQSPKPPETRKRVGVDVPRLVRVGRSLDDELDYAAEHLPEGWSIRIDVERGAGSVTAIRPDGSEVDMSDGESDLSEQFRYAVRLADDEIESDKLSNANAEVRHGAMDADLD